MNTFWVTLVSAGMGAFLAQLAGAFVKGRVGQGRYIEKCRDADLEALNATVEELKFCCIEYFSVDVDKVGITEEMRRMRIIGLFTQISGFSQILFGDEISVAEAANWELRPIYRKVTDDDFGDPERKKDLSKVGYIQSATSRLSINNTRRRRKLKRSFLAD